MCSNFLFFKKLSLFSYPLSAILSLFLKQQLQLAYSGAAAVTAVLYVRTNSNVKNKTMKKILFLACLLVGGIALQSFIEKPAERSNTITIYGWVESDLGDPISDVEVSFSHTHLTTETESDGYYEIRVPSSSSITVTFSHPDYESEQKPASGSSDEEVNAVMSESQQ